MRKLDLIKEIADKTGISQVKSEEILHTTLSIIMDEVNNNGEIKLNGFGSFKLKKRGPKKARNLKTGSVLVVPESLYPAFKPSKKFIESVNSSDGQ